MEATIDYDKARDVLEKQRAASHPNSNMHKALDIALEALNRDRESHIALEGARDAVSLLDNSAHKAALTQGGEEYARLVAPGLLRDVALRMATHFGDLARHCALGDASKRIAMERMRQEHKWGTQDHDPFTWIAILQEEIGEYAHEALKLRTCDADAGVSVRTRLERLEIECVQVAAVAHAMLDCLLRAKWEWPS